jgi:membrane protease YdiL (CAAX protease family)
MHHLTAAARRWPLGTYFVIAFAFTWALLPFTRDSIAAGLVALCGPAVSAFVTAALCGRAEITNLRKRLLLWRLPVRWYLLALTLPLPISLLASSIEYLADAHGELRMQPVSALSLVVFVLVIGEETGWRGFALPRLLARSGPWLASTLLGLAWALWHLPLFYMASMPQFGRPFTAFVVYTIALSLILTWLAGRTRTSVIIATLFHGAVNTFVVENAAASPALRGWGNAVAYGVAAVVIGLVAWRGRIGPDMRAT